MMEFEKTEAKKAVQEDSPPATRKVSDPVEDRAVTYRSSRPGLIITLRNAKRILYEGEPLNQEALQAEFKDGVFATEDREIITRIDALIHGRHAAAWARLITKDPPVSVIKKASKTSMKIAKAQKEAVEKVLAEEKAEDIDAYTAFQEYQKRLQSVKKTKVYTGMRG